MEGIITAQQHLEKRMHLAKAIKDAQNNLALLQSVRDSVVDDVNAAPLAAAKLKQGAKQSFDKLEEDLKEVNKGINQYSKALDRKLSKNALPTASTEPLEEQPDLIDRAIVMHLLREGKFEVANTLVSQLNKRMLATGGQEEKLAGNAGDAIKNWVQELAYPETWEQEGGLVIETGNGHERGWLQKKFTEMYHILDSLRNAHDLAPAIEWARTHSRELEKRGSNLEFELSRLKFVELFTGEDVMSDDPWEGPSRALEYAQAVFPNFSSRYTRETASLLGSLAFARDLRDSPYEALFYNETAWEEASTSFTREFCGLLGLSEKSPLYTAVTAGGIALPVLEKVERIMTQTRGSWTSVNELPVETPLPKAFRFHSIFVCPVSKEQATDANPPMRLPCGHVLAKESIDAHARGKSYVEPESPIHASVMSLIISCSKMKCPYCPKECRPGEAMRLFI